jgi:hypothetical protein
VYVRAAGNKRRRRVPEAGRMFAQGKWVLRHCIAPSPARALTPSGSLPPAQRASECGDDRRHRKPGVDVIYQPFTSRPSSASETNAPRHRRLPVAHVCSYTSAERETSNNNPRHHTHSFNMASAQSPEARELALVGKVEMRIALADSDKKLEDLLKLYLSPLLLKLGSDSVAVRNKVRKHTCQGRTGGLTFCSTANGGLL